MRMVWWRELKWWIAASLCLAAMILVNKEMGLPLCSAWKTLWMRFEPQAKYKTVKRRTR